MIRKTLAFAALAVCSAVATAQGCFPTSIISPSPFMGNDGEIFKAADGSIWEVKYEYSYLYEYFPSVMICPSRGKLAIKGKMLNIAQVAGPARSTGNTSRSAEVVESQIDGDFNGWEGETIFKLRNGQIWQQASYAYTYSYKYAPKVFIFKTSGGYEMQVDGMDSRIRVVQLR